LDLDEYALSEAQRTLKRLGLTHVWRESFSEDSPGSVTENHSEAVAVQRHVSGPERSASGGTARDNPPRGRTARPANASRRPETAAAEEPMPPLLRSLFHGKHSPCRTLWTYAGLYADLQQHAVSARLDLFRKIQASVVSHLGWPANDVAAWPLDLPERQFIKGIVFFRPIHIIAFGTDFELPSPAEDSEAFLILKKCRIHVLPPLDAMATGNKDMKNAAWSALKEISLQA